MQGGYFDINLRDAGFQDETFEFLSKLGNSSFLRKQESSSFKIFWIPAFAEKTKKERFSKVSGSEPA
jgi:hypothetical protein